jgi:hypothetical protein
VDVEHRAARGSEDEARGALISTGRNGGGDRTRTQRTRIDSGL